MPLYVYRCPDGHITEQIVRIDGSDAPTACPACVNPDALECECAKPLTKLLAPVADTFPGADSWRSKNGA